MGDLKVSIQRHLGVGPIRRANLTGAAAESLEARVRPCKLRPPTPRHGQAEEETNRRPALRQRAAQEGLHDHLHQWHPCERQEMRRAGCPRHGGPGILPGAI